MTVVLGGHHHRLGRRVILKGVDDEGAEVISLPQAPDAIELRHLRAFVAVASELNFGRAAARLYLSQPALSRQVSSLERLVGRELLRRSTHRVELTLAGEALLNRARELLRSLDEAVTVTRSVGGEFLARANKHWELAGLGSELAAPSHDTQELRDAVEALHAQFEPPPGISVRPVSAAGVAALLNSPQPGEPATVLHLHGGAYMAGSAFGYRSLAGCLADAARAGVLVPDYRLAPEHPFPAAVEDVCPLNADLTGLPPLLVQAANGDPVLGDATSLVDRAVEAGVDARFELFAVDTHDFHIFWSFLPEAASAMRQAGRFVREARLSPGPHQEGGLTGPPGTQPAGPHG